MINRRKLLKSVFAFACGTAILANITPVPVMADGDLTGRVVSLGGDFLNVRAEASSDSQWKGYLRENESVPVLSYEYDEEGNIWYEIEFGSGPAFVIGDYISLEEDNTADIIDDNGSSYNESHGSFYTSGTVYGLDGNMLNVRSGAGTDYSKYGTYTEGAKIDITGTAYDGEGSLWYEISYNGAPAYVYGAYVNLSGDGTDDQYEDTTGSRMETSEISAGTVVNLDGDLLNIRREAGTNSPVAGTLKEGDAVYISGETADRNGNKWYRIEYDGKTGYIHSYYVSFDTSGTYETYTPSVGESIVQLANAYAADDSHGYRNVSGDNTGYGATGSFDCGGFVSRVMWDLGLLPENKLYEPNSGMEWVLVNNGFEAIGYDYNILQPGDVLYRSGHTVIYAGNGQVVGAHGYAGNYAAGDQTGEEVGLCDFYGYWEYIFRYTGA